MAPTPDTPAAVSPLLLAAQERLLELRRANRERLAHQLAKRLEAPASPEPLSTADSPAPNRARPSYIDQPAPPPTLAETIATLPPHLGWENPRFAEHIRRIRNYELGIRNEEGEVAGGGLQVAGCRSHVAGCTSQVADGTTTGRHDDMRLSASADDPTTAGLPARRPDTPSPSETPNSQFLIPNSSPHIRLFPDLALGMLRRKKTAAGRVWLLLRHLDRDGRGWLTIAEITAALTDDDSPLRICGRRQLQNLLRQGDGLFWDLPDRTDLRGLGRPLRSTQDAPRLWLRSVARVAAGLGVGRLAVAPVAVDITALTGTIGHVRAHLFASFHSGRQKTDFVTGRPQARAPIARATMQTLTDACPNSQRAYEQRAGVSRRTAFAVGPAAPPPKTTSAVAQETAWQRGRATFRLTDHRGRYGRPGRTYLAWQLPNEYTGPHKRLTRGRMKRLNRALADLLDNGMTGNDERPEAPRPPSKRFFGNAKAAWTADRRDPAPTPTDRYYRAADGSWQVWSITNYELGITNYELGSAGDKRYRRDNRRTENIRCSDPISPIGSPGDERQTTGNA